MVAVAGSDFAARVRAEIRALLKQQDLSQAWLARQAHISENHLSAVLNAKSGLSFEVAEQLLGILGRRLVFETATTEARTP